MKQTIWTIMWFDWKQIRRSNSFWILTVLMLLTGTYAAIYGKNQIKEQQQKISILHHDIDSSMDAVEKRFEKQDTIPSWNYYDFLFALHSNRPDGTAALSIGQRDLHKFAVSITIGSYFYNRYAGGYQNKTLSGEIVNPQKQFAGHLDVSFVLSFLLPLYFILISYNLLSSEQENGTLSLLFINNLSIRQFSFTRLTFRYSITLIIGWMIINLGAAIVDAEIDERLLYYLLSTTLYLACWASIISIIIALQKSSGQNALLLISTWLLFSIALPAAFTAILNATHPTGIKNDLTTTVQKANSKAFQTPHPDLAKRFYAVYPQYNNLPNDTFPGKWYNPRWMRAVHLMIDREAEPLEVKYNHILANRIKAADELDFFSPVVVVQNIYNRISASDMMQMFAYDTSLYGHFSRWRDYLDQRTYLHNDKITKEEFKNLPKENFVPVINYDQIWYRLLTLFLIAVFALIISSGITKHKPDNFR